MSELWRIGFFLGFLLGGFLIYKAVYTLVIKDKLNRLLPPKRKPPPLSKEKASFISEQDTLSQENREPAEWFNHLCSWLYERFQENSLSNDLLFYGALNRAVVDIRRGSLGYLLNDSQLESVHIGEELPKWSNLKVLPDDKGLSLSADIQYSGDYGVTIRYETIFGIQIWIRWRLRELQGRMLLTLEDDVMHMWLDRPNIVDGECNIWLGGWSFPWMDMILSTFIFPLIVRSKYQIPNMRSKWILNRPKYPYYPWDPEILVNPDLIYHPINP